MPIEGAHTWRLLMIYSNCTRLREFGVLSLVVLIGMLSLYGCSAKEKPTTPEEYLRLGNQQLGRKRQQQAREYYQQLLENFPDSAYKAEAQFNIAESLYNEGDYLEARFEYEKFLQLHPVHPLASRAQFQLGMCSLKQVLSYDRDQTHTHQALQAFRLLRRQYPQDPLVPAAEAHIRTLRERLAARELYVARFYYNKKAYQAAIGRLLNLIQVYPTTPALDEVLYMLADSYHAEENYVKAQRALRLLVDRFPESTYVSRARTQLRRLPNTGIALQ